MIVFDELPTVSLLDASGHVDPVRYPNFARLAGESNWFPYATGSFDETGRALESMLSGSTPELLRVSKASGYVPTHITGRLAGGGASSQGSVAVAVNGVIVATSPVFTLRGVRGRLFSGMVPESSLHEGRNDVLDTRHWARAGRRPHPRAAELSGEADDYALEPESVALARIAAATSPRVSHFIRFAVSQADVLVPSHARRPLAPPTAAAALVMHCAHIADNVAANEGHMRRSWRAQGPPQPVRALGGEG